MPLGSAHRLAPEALFLDPHHEADAATLEAGFERLAAFSPGIAGETDPAAPGFGTIEVQLDGLTRLWGAEPLLAGRMARELAGVLPGVPLAGVAGTRFAAAVAAREARRDVEGGPASGTASGAADRLPVRIVEPGGDAAFLAPLPAGLLSRDPQTRGRLERLGLHQIGALAALPRSALVARFGSEGERLHARARGEENEPFQPRRAAERLALALPIEPPVAELEPLRFVLHRLAATFGDQLVARGAAAGRARLTLSLDRSFVAGDLAPTLTIDQRLPEPTAEGLAVERLLMARLEAAPPPAPVARLELELGQVAPAAGCQLTLFNPQAGRTARLGWQLARLALRFGEGRVGWAAIVDPEAPLAEERWAWRAVAAGDVEASEAGPATVHLHEPAS